MYSGYAKIALTYEENKSQIIIVKEGVVGIDIIMIY
jgi:hypothetical protein